jgi:hypothetical protein
MGNLELSASTEAPKFSPGTLVSVKTSAAPRYSPGEQVYIMAVIGPDEISAHPEHFSHLPPGRVYFALVGEAKDDHSFFVAESDLEPGNSN